MPIEAEVEMQMNERSGECETEKIAISSVGKEFESQVDPRFGRCAYFAIVDSSDALCVVENTAREFTNGAGIQAARQVCEMKVDAVVTGDIGPNAFRVLSAAGIRVFVGGAGTVRDALKWYRNGSLREAVTSTAAGHRGMGGRRWR